MSFNQYNKFILRLLQGQMHKHQFFTPQKRSVIGPKRDIYLETTNQRTDNGRNSSGAYKQYIDDNARIQVDYQRISSGNQLGTSSRMGHVQTSPFKNSKDNYAIRSPSPTSHSHLHKQEYFKMTESQLKNILRQYQFQVAALKDYIHQSEILQRRRIIDIFGFNYHNYVHVDGDVCECYIRGEQSKIVLKELSSRVSGLIKENQRLKSRQKDFGVRNRREGIRMQIQDERLINQNKKLRTIIEQYKHAENVGTEKLRNEIYHLKKHIDGLEAHNRQLSSSQKTSVIRRQPAYNRDDFQFAKNQLTKTMHHYSQQLQQKNQALKIRVDNQQKKIGILQRTVSDYKKQRSYKIQSTIRKSFIKSQSIKRPMGDLDNEESHRNSQMVRDLEESFSRHPKVKSMIVYPPANNQSQNHNFRVLEDRIRMFEMRNNNLIQENKSLSMQLKQSQSKNSAKVSQILELQKQLMKLRNCEHRMPKVSHQVRIIQKQKHDPQLQHEIRIIRQMLQSCNITNYDLFFKQFNEILHQRNMMKNQLSQFQVVNEKVSSKRTKQQSDILNKKINQLNEQNNRLINKVAELQQQIQKYHNQVLSEQIKKLSSINLSKQSVPSGKQALQWQRIVKSCIENSVMRLSSIQHRMASKKTLGSASVVRNSNSSFNDTNSKVEFNRKKLVIDTEHN